MRVSLKLDKKEYTLGQPIMAEVTVTNDGKAVQSTPKPALALAATSFKLTREAGAKTPESYIVRAGLETPTVSLKPGESVSSVIELLAIEPGTYSLSAIHGHMGGWRGNFNDSNAAASPPEKITVSPPAKGQKIKARMETEAGTIVLGFLPERAHNHALSWLQLAKKGYFNGIKFHRVVPNFVIQGGDPTGTGSGGPGYKIPAEFNEIKHVPGILSMARTNDPHSGGSQFFLCTAVTPHLDNQYTVFGQVEDGMDAVMKIGASESNARKFSMKKVEVFVA